MYWERAASTSTPGAVRSGLRASSFMRGPALENWASWSDASTAPTVSAASAVPGAPRLYGSGPSLPAATTKSAPVSALSRFTAWLIGSSWVCQDGPPRLMLITLACSVRAAHSMPAMIPTSCPSLCC